MEIVLIVLLITVMITPIVFCPLLLMDGYILPQIGVGFIGISIATILFVKQGVFPTNLSVLFALLFFIYFMVSGVWASVPHNASVEVPLIFLTVFAFMIASVLFKDNYLNMTAISLGVFFTAMFTSLYAIGQKFKFDPLFPERLTGKNNKGETFADTRAISSIGNTAFACGYFCSTLPFILYLIFEISAWFTLALAVVFIAILATKNRAGLLAVISSTILFLIVVSKKGMLFDILFSLFGNMRIEVILIFLTLTLSFGGTLYLWAREKNPLKALSEDNRLNNFLDLEGTHQDHPIATLRYRFRYWTTGLELFFRRPLHGFGLRSYRREVYDSQARVVAKDPSFMDYNYQTPQPRECHNDFLEYFVEGGVVAGFLLLFIMGSVLYNAYAYQGDNFLLVAAVSSGVICLLINAFFFFPLRLASSGLTFWVSLAMLESLTGSISLIPVHINTVVIIFIALALMAMLWEGVIKPNLSNYYFTKYNFTTSAKRFEYLQKSCDMRPNDSIPRTHLLMAHLYMDIYLADRHAEVLKHSFDGMVPGWVMYYNNGVVKALKGNYQDSLRYFYDSIKMYPAFEESVREYHKIFPLAPLPPYRKGDIMKRITDEGISNIKRFEAEINSQRQAIGSLELSIATIILHEKVLKNIPANWVFDANEHVFLPPEQLGDRQVAYMGPTKIPVILPAHMQA